jgi:uncharacterized integral membrane protein
MREDLVPYVLSIVFFAAVFLGITLLGAFVYGAVMGVLGGAGLFRAPLFLRAAADALFCEGGVMLTLGALVEFSLRAYSRSLARGIMLPYSLASRMAPRGDAPGEPQKPYSGGWMLIYSGALLLISSLAFAIISVK